MSNLNRLHLIHDRFVDGRFVPNGLANKGPFWERFLNQELEYSAPFCRTPLLTLLAAENISYIQSVITETNFEEPKDYIYLFEMLYSLAVWLKKKNGEDFSLHPFSQISEEALTQMRAGRLKLVITHLKRSERDSYRQDIFLGIQRRLEEYQIPPEQVYFIGCDEDWQEHFEKAQTENPEIKRWGGAIYIPYFERGWFHYFQAYLKKDQTYTPQEFSADLKKPRPKKYLSFNREPRAHRQVVAGWLEQKGLVEQGLISFPRPDEYFALDKFNMYQEGVEDLFHAPEWISAGTEGIQKFAEKAPYHVDHDDLTKLHISWCTKKPFQNSYFSLLTERLYYSANGHSLLTSKSYKAMCNMHPFIIVGAHRSLSFLKKMGYKTFSNWFDESYDEEPCSDCRMRLVLAEVERLCSLSDTLWLQMLEEMQETLLWNYSNVQKRQGINFMNYLNPILTKEL